MKLKKLLKFTSVMLAATMLVACNTASVGESTSSEEEEPIINAQEHFAEIDGGYAVYSPDKNVTMIIGAGERLFYSVNKGAETWIRPSWLGVTVGKTAYCGKSEIISTDVNYIKEDRTLLGNQSVVKCRCIETAFSLKQDDKKFKLIVRVYNDGIAFRYLLPEAERNARLTENTTYALRSDVSECWYSVYTGEIGSRDYEAVAEAHEPNEMQTKPVYPPMTAVVGDNRGYISIMEGDINSSYPGSTLSTLGDATFGTSFMSSTSLPEATPLSTAWRLINIADDLNGLVNNYNIYTLSEQPDETVYADTSWIEPGRSTWSWVAEGYFGEYGWGGIPTVSMMERYINVAAKLGYEYNIIDDGWPKWTDYKNSLANLGNYGNSNNVKQVLWGAITSGTEGYNKLDTKEDIDWFIDFLKETNMSGAKIDFWWDESNTKTTELQQYFLVEAAKEQLVMDFHGCNKNSGFNIAYPNELSREGIHGGEYFQMASADKVEYSRLINSQLFTRYLCGHADWTPGTYNAMEIGSIICIDSPLMVIASKPEDILNSPAVEFIKSIPTVWDKTYVLSDSKIGTYSAYAKESCGSWFVGAVASDSVADAKVTLSEFLPDGEYTAEVWYDNGAKMETNALTVTKNDVIDIGSLSAGEGYAIRLSKLTLSQYGGEINDNITVTAPNKATVMYTVDGTDPRTSSTAIKCDGAISLDDSCRLKVAITEGDGSGTMLSYRFNKLSQ